MPTAEAPQLSKAEAHLHLVAKGRHEEDAAAAERAALADEDLRKQAVPSLALAGIRLQQAASLQAGPCKRGRAQRTNASMTGRKAAARQLAAAAAQPPQPPPAEWRDIRRALRRKGPKACVIESSPCLCSRGQQDFAMTPGEQVKAKCGVYTRPLARTSAKNCKPSCE